MNIAIITIDTLRYDTTQVAKTPFLKEVFKHYDVGNWVRAGTSGTYTLPAHIAIFQEGRLPWTNDPQVKGIYNRDVELMFRAQLSWERDRPALYPTPSAPNIIKGFSSLGYRTLGVGGVHWFDNRFPTSNFWKENFFEEFYWQEDFGEENFDAFDKQLLLLEDKKIYQVSSVSPLFLFLNIPSCHFPYLGHEPSVFGQAAALDYVDSRMNRLFDLLPKPCHIVLTADHGECLGEDGLFGHGFYHPKIMEVPIASFILK